MAIPTAVMSPPRMPMQSARSATDPTCAGRSDGARMSTLRVAAEAIALEKHATIRLFENSRGASSGRRAIMYVVAGVRPSRKT
jgi:hypothetical protein